MHHAIGIDPFHPAAHQPGALDALIL